MHTSVGQEATAVGVIESLNKEIDNVYSNHRCHGHFISYCGDVKGLIAEIMGKDEGVCKGIGGSQHLHFRNFFSNGIQGAGVPIISGIALAEKLNKSNAISVIFVGDGTFGEGSLYEALNIISLWSIPVLLVIENNRYAQTTPIDMQLAGSFQSRATAFDIEFMEADGLDVREVLSASKTCTDFVRSEVKPCMLLLNTYRFSPHSKGDDFRSIDEINSYKKKDPFLVIKNNLDETSILKIENSNISLIEKIVEELIASQ